MRVKRVDTNDLVVCAGCEVAAIAREAYRVYGTRVIAHGGQLLGAIVGWIGDPENGLG